VEEAESVPRGGAGWGALAALLGGGGFLISWGLRAYGLLLVVLFVWPLVAPGSPTTLLPLEALARPVLEPLRALAPRLTVGGMDILPLVVAVVLLILRPRLVGLLARLEASCQGHAARQGSLD